MRRLLPGIPPDNSPHDLRHPTRKIPARVGQEPLQPKVQDMARLIALIETLMMCLAMLAVGAMMIVVSVDTIARYAFNAPLPWATEFIIYYLMVSATYFAISATYRHGDHINLDFLHHFVRKRLMSIIDCVSGLAVAATFLLVAWLAFHTVEETFASRSFIPGYISWPTWLSHLPILLGSAVMAVRVLHHSIQLGLHGEDPNVVTRTAVGGGVE